MVLQRQRWVCPCPRLLTCDTLHDSPEGPSALVLSPQLPWFRHVDKFVLHGCNNVRFEHVPFFPLNGPPRTPVTRRTGWWTGLQQWR